MTKCTDREYEDLDYIRRSVAALVMENNVEFWLGHTVTLQADPNLQQGALIDAKGRAQGAKQITVCFGNPEWQDSDCGANKSNRSAQIVADLQWQNAGGGYNRATVDVAMGVQVSVPAASVECTARFDGVTLDIPGEIAIPGTLYDRIQISAGITWGTRPARSYPTRTFSPMDLDTVAATGLIRIPPFSYAMHLWGCDPGQTGVVDSAVGLLVDFFSGPLVSDFLYTTILGATFDAARDSEGVRYPKHARYFRIRFDGEGDGLFAIPQFALNL